MRRLGMFSLLLGIAATVSLGKDRVAPQKPGRPIRIRPVPVRATFAMRVQTSARFKKQDRPAASKPATVKGLQITVQPEKKSFAGNGPLAFAVTLTNVSEKSFLLNRATLLGGSPRLVIFNQKTAAQWTLPGLGKQAKLPSKTRTLKPGETTTLTLVVESRFIGFPRPIPLPRPFPRPRPRPRVLPATPPRVVPRRRLKGNANAPAVLQKAILQKPGKRGRRAPIRRPIRPPVVWSPAMPCGQGPCRARLFLEFTAPDAAKTTKPFWSGKIAGNAIDFTVTKPQPIWTPGQPLKKEQAIRVAHPVAERALNAGYKPIAGLRPAKVGPWIESPQKDAAAKKDKNGNWTVSWTKFPKTGHSFNVTVTVSKFGGASVKEVFTGYSKAP